MTIRGKKVVWASITWFAASVFVASVNADDAELESASSRYQMAAVIDRARGNAVMAGDYQKAIAKLDSRGLKRFEASTNLCVAYTMTGELQKADEACAAAFMASKKSEERRDMAVALSNLGVVKAIGGDHRGAQEDFSRALELNAGLQQASENLQRLRDGDA